MGHTSPLDIEIPGAEPGREWEYYYHDRCVLHFGGMAAGLLGLCVCSVGFSRQCVLRLCKHLPVMGAQTEW